jgi:hypothetical protein
MASRFADVEEASTYVEVVAADIFDVYDDLFEHVYKILAKKGTLDGLDEDHMICLVRAAIRTTELDKHMEEAIGESLRSLQAWEEGFKRVPQTHSNLLPHMLTQIFFFCISIFIATWRDSNICLVDRFEPEFEYFTGLCEQYLKLHTAKTSHFNIFEDCDRELNDRFHTPPAFSIGSGVVTCLAAIIEKCRISSIRHRCIALLRKINLKGIFDTAYLATYLQMIVEYEEQAARRQNSELDLSVGLRACDVPEDARLLQVVMSPARHRARFDFYRTNQVNAIYAIDRRGLQLGYLSAYVVSPVEEQE